MSRHSKHQHDAWLTSTGFKMNGTRVKPRGGERGFGNGLRDFKRKVNDEGILQELRGREYFETRGERRRREKAEAIRRFARARRTEEEEAQI